MAKPEKEERTIISNEIALWQFVSPDGSCVCSIVQNREGLFFFVVEQEMIEPATSALASYAYWEERQRSGLYGSFSAAEAEARVILNQLGQGT